MSPRYPMGGAAAVVVHRRRLAIEVLDASADGLRFNGRFEPETDLLEVEIEARGERLTLAARVIHVTFHQGTYQVGAQFIGLDTHQMKHLTRFIAAHAHFEGTPLSRTR